MSDHIERYFDELYRWNERINLTSIPRGEADAKHLGDTERLIAAIDTELEQSIVDVGSGGGVPGILIALLRPRWAVTLVEADQRKAAFLIHSAGLLEIGNLTVIAERAETVGQGPLRERFDVGVSRALAAPVVAGELILPMVCVGGRLATLVGDDIELAVVSPAFALCGGGPASFFSSGVLVCEKVQPTPASLPRSTGIPKRRPLVG